MIVYLDQNKWIELARIVLGKDDSIEAKTFLKELDSVVDAGLIKLPLSAVHCVETVRNKSAGSRQRLGEVMWNYSKQNWIASNRDIVIHELEEVLSNFFPTIKKGEFHLIGKGMEHGFGARLETPLPPEQEEVVQKAILTGEKLLNRSFPSISLNNHRESFKNFLKDLHEKKSKLRPSQWHAWLVGLAIVDVMEPLYFVFMKNGLSSEQTKDFKKKDWEFIVMNMPSRRVDHHLMKQVLKNRQYKPKSGDVFDWSALGIASQYCDVVICEKHMADWLHRDNLKIKARIETSLKSIFSNIESNASDNRDRTPHH